MEIMKFIKDYWFLITFICGILISLGSIIKTMVEATKCSLRNDILEIYDKCKETQKITHYQLKSIQYSSEIYFKLHGNSFVKDIMERVSKFDLID